jgi:hypothetical protein
MNMFRNLLCLFLVGFGIALIVSSPSQWALAQRAGQDVISFLKICETFRPFVIGACWITALALFMTRKIY